MIERYSLSPMTEIWSEANHFQKMLEVEILVCEAWAKLEKLPEKNLQQIKKKAKFDLKRIQEIEATVRHDVIAFVSNVSENIGKDAGYFHFGVTSSDILDTSLSLLMREAADVLLKDLEELENALIVEARKYANVPCVGRTHGIHAEPTTFGLKLALYVEEIRRNRKRMEQARETINYGKISGAVGTYAHVPPFIEEYVCRKLNLIPAPISTQILQRDRHAEYLTVIAIIGSSLEKLATEIRGLQRTEIMEAQEHFSSGQKGSSAMPHKRNPVACERISGLARLLRGNAQAAMENVCLWHERDISHSSVERVIIPDSTLVLHYLLRQAREIIDGLVVYPENMKANLEKSRGLIFSQAVLLALVRKGVGRDDAYRMVQRCSRQVWSGTISFKEALLADKEVTDYLDSREIEACFNVAHYTRYAEKILQRLKIV